MSWHDDPEQALRRRKDDCPICHGSGIEYTEYGISDCAECGGTGRFHPAKKTEPAED